MLITGFAALSFAFFLCNAQQVSSIKASSSANEDLIKQLPGLTFDPGFTQYSGFLPTKSHSNLFYWLVESQNNPKTDPLLLWLNGGPGCSSLYGLFTELGPFRVDPDGETLFENVHSWNKVANVLFLESPHDVGFSYSDESVANRLPWNDDNTAVDNADALEVFFARFPEYHNRPFYLSGESYAGVYVPMLADLLIKRIQSKQLVGVNLAGIAVGNGILSQVDEINSVINLFYYRGMLGMDQYNSLSDCCLDEGGIPLSSCNFSRYLNWTNEGTPNQYNDPSKNQCAQKIYEFSNGDALNDRYNSYLDCYMEKVSSSSIRASKTSRSKRSFYQFDSNSRVPLKGEYSEFIDQGARINIGSTDAQYGFSCWNTEVAISYLNEPDVRSAIHVPEALPKWIDCSDQVSLEYQRQYYYMMPFFDSIIHSAYNLSILIFNGDADTVCNFLGDEWFILRLAEKHQFGKTTERHQWTYRQSDKFIEQIAGYQQRFTKNGVVMDLLTVKGAGHFVEVDRSGTSLQMITNFILNRNYNETVTYNTDPKPILQKFQPTNVKRTRKQMDRVWYLPGLTFEPNFKHYSGYLNGEPGNYLHYWLLESQRNPSSDPLILWMNGGPGCSSLGGLLYENGPFHPNPDNKTLFENMYSWNKLANVIYLETPPMTGFSWQNLSINPDELWDDDKTAENTFTALMDFLSIFPEYHGRPFYFTGESYAGVYIPVLTAYTIKQIKAGNANGLNLSGIAIGNGYLSAKEQLNSVITLLHYRGQYGKRQFDALQSCCPNQNDPPFYCDYSKFITFTSNGSATPIDGSTCAKLISQYGYHYLWDMHGLQDPMNLFEAGYRQYQSIHNILKSSKSDYSKKNGLDSRIVEQLQQEALKSNIQVYVNQRDKINYESTDGGGNFYWYRQLTLPIYLNISGVREALHIPPYVQSWVDCNKTIENKFNQKYHDTTPVFREIIDSGYRLRMLIYNGDADTLCQFLGDEWFVEKLANSYLMTVPQSRTEWKYQSQRAGYWKQFKHAANTIDLVTIKGAGHYVPLDRPGPALQMINNFIENVDYSTPVPFVTALSPLKPQYLVEKQISAYEMNKPDDKFHKVQKRSEKKKIDPKDSESIVPPGLSFEPKFEQYSGFLPGLNGAKLFYWLIESPLPIRDLNPLIIWIGNDPGCSVLFDAVNNFGPYRLCPFGTTLYENPYAWNQVANLLFLESAPGVGYSPAVDEIYTDDKVVDGLVNAVSEFLKKYTVYSPMKSYVFGKGYGSIHALLLTEKLLKLMKEGKIKMNLQGIGLGNALLNYNNMINTIPNELYFSGLIGKDEWDVLIPCCQLPNGTYNKNCDLSQYVNVLSNGIVHPKQFSDALPSICPVVIAFLVQDELQKRISQTGNMYGSCYGGFLPEGGNQRSDRRKRDVPHNDGLPMTDNYLFVDQADRFNYLSTDAFGSYPCYMYFATDELFIEQFVHGKQVAISSRDPWTYQADEQWMKQYAGFVQTFLADSLKIDLITVKGAGQFISLDRPATALQMIGNFIKSKPFDTIVPVIPVQPLKPNHRPRPAKQVSRMVADEILDLPGLTYQINFKQYAGYLRATKGNYLHYWFVESQNVPSTDPVIVWFTGGPGCSSIGGMLTENGPFRVNPDGITLYENVFSWNKTKVDAYLAIMDFFTIFENMRNNDFYISGESYGGIYVPTLTDYMIGMIQKGQSNLQLKGMLVGNGAMSTLINIRSIANFLYMHGIYGKDEWDELQKCCPSSSEPITQCPFENYVISDGMHIKPIESSNQTIQKCSQLVIELARDRVWEANYDIYNLYQSCYSQAVPITPFLDQIKDSKFKHSRKLRANVKKLYADLGLAYAKTVPWGVNTQSTDAVGGFTCYMFYATQNYLNQVHVRDALHVPDYVQPWELCSDIPYVELYNDTTSVFNSILASGYPLNMLIYNGDLDTACSMFEAEWFIEKFSENHKMAESDHSAWLYQLSTQFQPQIGGYKKGFKKSNLTINLVTVKGAGHMVPADRAGPMLQLLVNFISGNNYNVPSPFSFARKPLLPQFQQPSATTPKPTTPKYEGAAPAVYSSMISIILLFALLLHL